MLNPKNIFHKISYLQYPIMIIGLYYALVPYFNGFTNYWTNINSALIFMGLSISFSTLQDTAKTQNKLSRKVWENPKKGRRTLIIISVLAIFLVVTGIYGLHISVSGILKEVSFGILVLGIGVIGMLKAAVEMFENHRLDKNQLLK